MRGLISADFKKLFRGKTLIVCMIIAVIFGAFMAAIYNYAWVENKENITMVRQLLEGMGMDEKTVETSLMSIPQDNLFSYANTLLSDGSIIYFAAVCVCVFVASEYVMGTFKNTVSRGFSRLKIYSSKLIAAIVSVIAVSLAYVLGGCLMCLTFVSGKSETPIGQIFEMLGIYLVLMAALAAFYTMLSIIFDRTGISIAAAIVLPIFVSTIINVASMANEKINDIQNYLLVNMFMYVKVNCADGKGWIMLLVALGYLIVTSVIGFLVFSRKEIK